MSVRIRLSRVGTNNIPLFRLVVATRERPIRGKFLEILGTYNPKLEKDKLSIDKDRLGYWLKQGATATVSVAQLLKQQGLAQ